jgi:sodium/bile acid cotransporter 7
LGYTKEVVVAATFTASHKTMAFGLPLIKVIFEGNPNLASYCTPVMMIHPLQLSLGSMMVPWFKSYISKMHNKEGREDK